MDTIHQDDDWTRVWVATLAGLIIPTTDTPGARVALVDRFIDNVMANAQPADKERFLAGLTWMDTRSTALSIAADWFGQSLGLDEADLLAKRIEERRHRWRDLEPPPEGCLEFVQHGSRRSDDARAKRAMHHFPAEPLGDQRGHQDVRVENDGHETIVKTSSSV